MQYGILFAIPYAVTAVIMILNSWHSDKTHERRGHVAAIYVLSGISSHSERPVERAFLDFLRIDVPGDSGTIRSHGSVLGHSK